MKKSTLFNLVLLVVVVFTVYHFADILATRLANFLNIIQLNYFSQFESINLLRR